MYSQRQIDLARLSLYAYDYEVYQEDETKRNRTGIPEGWTQVASRTNPVDGFQSYAFLSPDRTELVVAFTGTRFEPEKPRDVDWNTNLNGGGGFADALQFGDAIAFFRDLMAMDESLLPAVAKEQAMFTGHSLGGGLALFMGAAFDRPALGFAPAPFEQKLLSPSAMLALQGFYDTGLPHGERFAEILAAARQKAQGGDAQALADLVHDRESRLSSISIDHEIVTLYQRDPVLFALGGAALAVAVSLYAPHLALALTAGQVFLPDAPDMYLGDRNMEWLTVSGLNLGFVPSHAMHWHLALMAHEGLREAIGALPQLAPIVDGYGANPYGETQVLLLKLLNNHYGVRNGSSAEYLIAPNGWLDRFVADAGVLAQAVGAGTQSDAVAGALGVLANHYWRHPDGVAADPFFTAHEWGLSFHETASGMGDDWYATTGHALWADILDDVPGNEDSAVHAAGLDVWREVWQPLSAALAWHVQFGDTSMTVAGDDEHGIFLGGLNADHIDGGGGNDLLAGNAGDDTLAGGEGDDVLIGGAGHDVYRYASSDGRDLIIDSDRSGHLEINGTPLLQADALLTRDGSRAWYNAALDVVLRFEPGQGQGALGPVGSLFISGDGLGGDTNRIEIRHFEWNPVGTSPFGITLAESPRLALLSGQPARNPFLDPAYVPPAVPAVSLDADDVVMVTLALNTVSDEAREIRLQAGSDAAVGLLINGRTQAFSGGALSLWVPAGQSMLAFGIRQAGTVDAETPFTLSAAFADGSGAGHLLALSLQEESVYEGAGAAYAGTDANDWFWLLGEPSAVEVDGGGGDDLLVGGAYGDVLVGGAGVDGLTGAGGNDFLYAAGVLSVEEAITHGDDGAPATFDPLQRVDVLSGYDGDDVLIASSASDLLAGGPGSDVLVGGAGADVLLSSIALSPDGMGLFDARLSSRRGEWVTESGLVVSVLESVTVTARAGLFGEPVPRDGVEGSDRLHGGAGDDALYGSRGADRLSGGSGNDLLVGNLGDDVLLGGDGNDYLIGGRQSFTFVDAVYGGAYPMLAGKDEDNGNDLLDGGAGHDALFGRGGHDVLYGGDGDDALYGDWINADWWNAGAASRAGDDWLDGGAGRDRLVGGHGNDELRGGAGDDLLLGDHDDAGIDGSGDPRDGHDVLDGGDGNDRLLGNGGNDVLRGGSGADLLEGGRGNDQLRGDGDDDSLFAGSGDDHLHGGTGNDQLYGDDLDEDGRDVLFGDDGDDVLGGIGGDDILYGGHGNDQLHGDAGDLPASRHANDRLYGEAGNDYLVGYGGDDLLDGGAGDDTLHGMDGQDRLHGGAGRDYLDGGAGDDALDGGEGDDVYFIGNEPGSTRITDSGGTDLIVFGPGFDPAGLQFFPGSLGIRFAGSDAEIHIEGFDATDANAVSPIEFIGFQATPDGPLTVQSTRTLLQQNGFHVHAESFVQGTARADRLSLGDGGGLLAGGAGDDVLLGGAGNDLLHGGPGNDRLVGGCGDDTFLFGWGDGEDTLADSDDSLADAGSEGAGGYDRVQFGEGIRVADLRLDPLSADGTLVASIGQNGDRLRFLDWTNPEATVEAWCFRDGTTLDHATILHALGNAAPVCGDDVLAVSVGAAGTSASARMNLLENDRDDRTAGSGLAILGSAIATPPAPGASAALGVGDNRGRYGWLRVAANGDIEYVADVSLPAVQSLAAGGMLTEVFTYRVSDNEPLYAQAGGATLTINVTRTADAGGPEPVPDPSPQPGPGPQPEPGPAPGPKPKPPKPPRPAPGQGVDPPGLGRRPDFVPGTPPGLSAAPGEPATGVGLPDWLHLPSLPFPSMMSSAPFAALPAAGAARLPPPERLFPG